MKIKYVMNLAFAATLALFASCSNDNDGFETSNAEMALVKVSFVGASSASRAFDDEEKGVALQDVKLYYSIGPDVFTPENGYISNPGMETPLGVNGTTYSISVPSNAEKLYVIGNLGADANYPATSSMKTFTKALADLNTDAIWSYGDTPLSFTAAPTDAELEDGTAINLVAEAKVEMKLIPARIDVTLANEMVDFNKPKALRFTGVAVLYSAKETKIVSPFDVSPASYVHGLSNWTNVSSATKLDALYRVWAPTQTNTPAQDGKETFYVLPPAGDKHLILTALATKDGETVYFPVHFDGTDVAATIEAGNRYEVTITFKGNALEGNGGGTIDPEIPVQDAAVTVEIKPAKWNVVSGINKEFN